MSFPFKINNLRGEYYEIEKILGSGAYGKVYQARNESNMK